MNLWKGRKRPYSAPIPQVKLVVVVVVIAATIVVIVVVMKYILQMW